MSAESKRSLKLVVIDSDEDIAPTIKTHFADKGVRLAGESIHLKAGMRLVRTLQPQLVLVEVPATNPEEALDAVASIHAELPECGIIVSADASSPQLILNGVRAGAHEFVSRPVDVAELARAIDHVRKRLDRRGPTGRRRGRTIALFSNKGGSGSSLVATNLAAALARRPDTRVVLVDLGFQLGDLSLMLDLQPRYGLSDVVGSTSLEETELRSVLTPHSSGLFLLTVAASPEDGHKVERQHVVEAFGLLSTMFDYIVVDIERHIDERTLEALDLSERILLVSTLTLPSVRNTKKCLDLFRGLEIDSAKCEIVVNRYDTKKSGVSVRDLEGTVGLSASWLIPNDFQTANQSIDSGEPFVISAASSKIARSFLDFAARIVGESASPVSARPSIAPAEVE